MTTMYRVRLGRIEAFEVLRTTEKQVVLLDPYRKGERQESRKPAQSKAPPADDFEDDSLPF